MKILHVTADFYPAWSCGGVARVAYELCKRLTVMGHEITVFTTDLYDNNARVKCESSNPIMIDGIKVYYFRNISNQLAWRRFHLPLSMIPSARGITKEFDIIHMHGYYSIPSIPVYHYAKKYNISYVLQAHGMLLTYFQKRLLKKTFDKLWGYRILKDASKLIAATSKEAEQYESMGISEDRIEIVPNGVTISEFEKLPQRGVFRREHAINGSQKIILYLGRIHKTKGLDLLAEAFSSVTNVLADAKLVITGPDDGYLPALKKLVEELRMEEKVIFTGPLHGEEKLKAYVDADVYVLPSIYDCENFGITVLEACACGLPVVVTDCCGIAGAIDNRTGIVVSCDKYQLSKAILDILGNDNLRQEYSKRGKLLVREQFNWDRIAQQIESVYQGISS